jgi:hypothetical protein
MAAEHLMFAQEAVWADGTTPNHAIPVESAGINPDQPLLTNEDTGGGRGRKPGAMDAMTVAGPVNMKLYPQTLGYLLKTMYGARVASAAGTGFRNKFLPDDDVDFDSICFQKRYGDALGETIRGAKLNGYTLTAAARQFVKLSTNWIAKDAAGSGGTFPDGTAAPAVVDPPPYLLGAADPLKFYQGVARVGGTVTNVSGELVVAGGTDRCEFDNVTLEVANNLSNDGFGVCLDDRTVQQISEGPRVITVGFAPNFRTVGFEFYNAWKEGADAVVELYFEGPAYNLTNHFIYKWTLPLVRYSQGANPELNAAYGLKRTAVQGMGYVDPTLLVDHGLVIQTTEDYS